MNWTCPFCDAPADTACGFCQALQAAEEVYCRPGKIPREVLEQITNEHRPRLECFIERVKLLSRAGKLAE